MTTAITHPNLLVKRSGQVVRRGSHRPLGWVSTLRPPWEWRASCECGWEGGVTWSQRRQSLDQLVEHLQKCPRLLPPTPPADERRPEGDERVVDFAQFAKAQGFELEDWQLKAAEESLDGPAPVELRHGEATVRHLVRQWREAA